MVRTILIAGLLGVFVAPQAPTRSDADIARRKVTAVLTHGAAAPAARAAAPVRTSFTERELNAYLQYDAPAELPAGVAAPRMTLPGDNKVAGEATVDLDAVRRSKQRGMLDPLSYVTGSLQVTVSGLLHVTNGLATFQLEHATIGGVPMPKSLLQELVAYYTRTPVHPQGLEIDKPFPMPAAIRSVEIQRGAVIVVQ
jgi:hypothetical protein